MSVPRNAFRKNFKALYDWLALNVLELSAALRGELSLPTIQYATAALQAAQMTGAQVAGAREVVFENTGTTPGNLQMPTAANLVAAIPGAVAGMQYKLKIRNSSSGANTATITTATGITLTGTMTIPQNTTREFIVTLTSLTAVAVRSIGTGAAGL